MTALVAVAASMAAAMAVELESMVAAVAVIWRPESSFRSERTWVPGRVVHPQYIMVKCQHLASCSSAFLWPKVQGVLLPPNEEDSDEQEAAQDEDQDEDHDDTVDEDNEVEENVDDADTSEYTSEYE